MPTHLNVVAVKRWTATRRQLLLALAASLAVLLFGVAFLAPWEPSNLPTGLRPSGCSSACVWVGGTELTLSDIRYTSGTGIGVVNLVVRVHPTLFPLTIRPSDWSVATPSGPQTERLVEPNTSVAVGPGGRYEARLTFTVKHVYWNGYGTYLTWHPSQLGLMGPVQVPIGPGAFDIANGTP